MGVINLKAKNEHVMTHPYAVVVSDGTPIGTTVLLVGKNGDSIDITDICRSVTMEPNDPVVKLEIFALKPREHLHGLPDELDRDLFVSV